MNYRGYELENVSCDTSTTGREFCEKEAHCEQWHCPFNRKEEDGE